MMTRLINEATLPRREGTGRSYGTQGPCFLGRARWPFPYTNHLGFLPSAFSELSPQSSALASGNRISLSLYLASSAPCFHGSSAPYPPEVGGEGACKALARTRTGEAQRACLPRKLPGNSRAITGPRRLPGVDCTAGAESGNTQQAMPGGGGGGQGICLVITWHKALRVFVPSVPQPAREESDVGLDPGPEELRAMQLGPRTWLPAPQLSYWVPQRSQISYPPKPLVPPPRLPLQPPRGKEVGQPGERISPGWSSLLARIPLPLPVLRGGAWQSCPLGKSSPPGVLSPASFPSLLATARGCPTQISCDSPDNTTTRGKQIPLFFFF